MPPQDKLTGEELDGLIKVLEEANPLWPIFVGHPETGEPIELSKEAYQTIIAALRNYRSPPHSYEFKEVPMGVKTGKRIVMQGGEIIATYPEPTNSETEC